MKRKILMLLTVMVVVSTPTINSKAETITVTQDTDLTTNPAAVTVTAEVAADYTIVIPKDMKMYKNDNNEYIYEYNIDVDGTIGDDEYISVIPQGEITLSTEGKDDVLITVTQEKQHFRSSTYVGDISTDPLAVLIDGTDTIPEANGLLQVKEGYKLTSGNWSGTLVFDISLEKDISSLNEASTVSSGDAGQ